MSWYRSRHAGPSVTPALPTQQKTVTATTSQQVVTPDSGYVLDEVTVNPQEHTASFTPTANLVGASGNANDMGVNHNKRYVNTSGMITPSGTKSITSNGTHDVSSYANASVSVDTSGTSITPSNSSPVRIYGGSTYTPTSSGYAISSYSSISPSSSPTSLSSGSIYKISSGGYAINDYSSSGITPSTSGASFSTGWNYMTSSGYAYSSKPYKKTTTDKLWTNSSPTSSFPAQTLSLSKNYNSSGYDFIIFEYIIDNSQNYSIDSSFGMQLYVSPKFLTRCLGNNNTPSGIGLFGRDRNGINWVRFIRTGSDLLYTSLYISAASQVGTGSTTTSNDMVILKYVYGQKITVG